MDGETSGLKERLEGARTELRIGLGTAVPGLQLSRAFSQAMSGIIKSVARDVAEHATILSIGALARGELCPFSDIDLVALVDEGDEERAESRLSDLVRPLWDLSLRVNAILLTPQSWLEQAEHDITQRTSILDAQVLVGEPARFTAVTERASQFWGGGRAAFIEALVEDGRERQRRYGGTVYRVEPDIKHGPGGMRDLHNVDWSLQATYGTRDPDVLVERGVLSPRGARALADSRDELLRLRCALHLAAGRAQERMVFRYQEDMPELLGLVPPGGSVEDAVLVQAIEAFMQSYYRAALDVVRYGGRVLSRVSPVTSGRTIEAVDQDFHLVDDELSARRPLDFVQAPGLALGAIAQARDRGVVLSAELLDSIDSAVGELPWGRLCGDREAQRRFLELLVNPADAGSPTAVQVLHDLGLLEQLVPEFAPSRGRMQHETFHVYTVDQHSLFAVEYLKSVGRGDYRKDRPLATAVHLGLDDLRVLYLAALLHDSGKAYGEQCVEGAKIARVAAQRAGLGGADADRCGKLVAMHLEMPMISQKRDLSDLALIADFAEEVGDKRTLAELYLLSLADTASVAPDFLTEWKATLLDELYLLTAAQLSARRMKMIGARGSEDEPEGLPDRYYMVFDPELRKKHKELLESFDHSIPVRLVMEDGSGAIRLTILAPDRRGLLFAVAAALDDAGYDTLAADIYSIDHKDQALALDVFRIAPRDPERAADAELVPMLESEIARRLGELDTHLEAPPVPLPQVGGRKSVDASVTFSLDTKGRRSVIEIIAPDRPGVFRLVTLAFASLGIDVELAKVVTDARESRESAYVVFVPRLDEARMQAVEARLIRDLA